jgi:ribonuclease HI
MKTVHICTDVCCRGHPGPGGWAFLRHDVDTHGRGHERVESGAVPHTTNRRMALQAVIQGLAALRAPCRVELYADAHEVITRLTSGGARTHHDVVTRLLAAAAPHHLTPHDRRGHAGYPDHTRVDAFAQQVASTGAGRARRRGLTCYRAAIWPAALVCTDARSRLGARMAS